MNENPEAVPQIKLNENAFDDGYHVELGGQHFTQAQWEAVQRYVEGTTAQAADAQDPEQDEDYVSMAMAERSRQAEKGYDAAHDDAHGIYHLLTEAQLYHMAGDQRAVAGLLQATREYVTRNNLRPVVDMQLLVKEFHEGMGQPVGLVPHPLPQQRVAVRVELVREEFEDELIPALYRGDLVETVDACIDILYVVFGLLVEMGVWAQPLFEEVQRSNMSKFGADGKAIIAGPNDPDGIFEGRIKKRGRNYFKPDLRSILLSGEADLG